MVAAGIFKALGDPLRLKMVQRLNRYSRCTISDISVGLGITRQGARKHLQVLADAKIVALSPVGRDVSVSLLPESLDQAVLFIADLERKWDMRLENLKRYVEDGSTG